MKQMLMKDIINKLVISSVNWKKESNGIFNLKNDGSRSMDTLLFYYVMHMKNGESEMEL